MKNTNFYQIFQVLHLGLHFNLKVVCLKGGGYKIVRLVPDFVLLIN
jgi:hypothetical protein